MPNTTGVHNGYLNQCDRCKVYVLQIEPFQPGLYICSLCTFNLDSLTIGHAQGGLIHAQ